MKVLLMTALMVFSFQGMAGHHEGDHKDWEEKFDKMSFEDAKKMKLEKLDKKRAMIEESRDCVNKSTDKQGLKACMKDMHEKKMDMKEEMNEKMKDMKKKK